MFANDIGERIKERRLQVNMSVAKLSQILNVHRATIYRWEDGSTEKIPTKTLTLLAHTLKTTPEYLLGLTDNSGIKANSLIASTTQKVKVINSEQDGITIDSYKDTGSDFCFIVKDNNMNGARIQKGDIVFIKAQEDVANGEIALVSVDGETFLKRVYHYPETNKLVLQSENPKCEPLIYIGEEIENVKTIGKAISFQSIIK